MVVIHTEDESWFFSGLVDLYRSYILLFFLPVYVLAFDTETVC